MFLNLNLPFSSTAQLCYFHRAVSGTGCYFLSILLLVPLPWLQVPQNDFNSFISELLISNYLNLLICFIKIWAVNYTDGYGIALFNKTLRGPQSLQKEFQTLKYTFYMPTFPEPPHKQCLCWGSSVSITSKQSPTSSNTFSNNWGLTFSLGDTRPFVFWIQPKSYPRFPL